MNKKHRTRYTVEKESLDISQNSISERRGQRISSMQIETGSKIHEGEFSQPSRLVVFDSPHVPDQAFPVLNNLSGR